MPFQMEVRDTGRVVTEAENVPAGTSGRPSVDVLTFDPRLPSERVRVATTDDQPKVCASGPSLFGPSASHSGDVTVGDSVTTWRNA